MWFSVINAANLSPAEAKAFIFFIQRIIRFTHHRAQGSGQARAQGTGHRAQGSGLGA